jgi:ubiquinone biosynthesis protein
MLDFQLTPTRLVPPGEQPPIVIVRGLSSPRFRAAYVLAQLAGLAARLVWLKVTGRLSHAALGRMLREFCEKMGVFWIKIGQLVSMRADMAPPAVCAELAKLQDRVSGFPPEIARRIVEEETGAPLERNFSEFEEVPIAAASIAQVHRARLRRSGHWLAVKVRRPYAKQNCMVDIALIRAIVRVLERLSLWGFGRWRDMLWEVEFAVREELDFRYEAANMRRLRKTLRDHGIYVPLVLGRLSTESVLVMEFVHGVLMSDYVKVAQSDPAGITAWLAANNVRPGLVARQLLLSHFRQLFEDNLFHSDLHPGNIILLRNSRLAFLDFGSLGTTEREFLRKFDLHMEAMATRNYSKMIDIFFLFSPSLPPIDLTDLKEQLIRRLQSWESRSLVQQLPFQEKSINVLMDDIVRRAARCGISPDWSFFRMLRATTTMDAAIRELWPQANFHRLVADYYRERHSRVRHELLTRFWEDAASPKELSDLQTQLAENAMHRDTIVRRAAQVFESTTSKIAQAVARGLVWTSRFILLIGIFVLVVCVGQRYDPGLAAALPAAVADSLHALPRLDGQVWTVIFILLVYSYFRLTALARRLQEREAQG